MYIVDLARCCLFTFESPRKTVQATVAPIPICATGCSDAQVLGTTLVNESTFPIAIAYGTCLFSSESNEELIIEWCIKLTAVYVTLAPCGSLQPIFFNKRLCSLQNSGAIFEIRIYYFWRYKLHSPVGITQREQSQALRYCIASIVLV